MDSIDFLALYTESGTNETYKDSLVITQQYNQGKGVVLFSQEAVATLKTQGLTIEHTQAESFVRDCDREKKAFRLISYQISSGFVATVPKIYMTQLFGEQDTNTLLLFSHSSEDASEQQQMRKAFSTIHCVK
ncbi:MAG: hypothetical protein LBP53_07835 [Candidatus Peribacteria bacterium]|jgi:hypothetical protein|nr:hypothetical protein [Candidatus Peribacteria bacterium]